MILFVPALLIAIAVLAWIAWLAIGPRSVSVPSQRFLIQPPSEEPRSTAGEAAASSATVESDYQKHVQNRLEDSPLPYGSVSGVSGPTGCRIASRDHDHPAPEAS